MDALFWTLARLANGMFHVARPLKRVNRRNKMKKCAAAVRLASQ